MRIFFLFETILLDKFNYTDITAKTGLSKSTLYRMCEPTSNPTLENIGKVLSYINDFDDKAAALYIKRISALLPQSTLDKDLLLSKP